MKIEINESTREALRKHLSEVEAKDRNILQKLNYRALDDHDRDVLVLGIRQLIEYGIEAQKENQSKWIDFNSGYMEQQVKRDDPMLSYELSAQYGSMFGRLMNDYIEKKNALDKDELFSKKISEMTGYEYERYELLRKKQ